MQILFISHSFPPTVGGVETHNYHLSQGLSTLADVKIIANSRGKRWLPLFLPWAFAKALFWMTRCDVCLLGNGVLAPLGAFLRFFHRRKRFFCVIHGLDVTYAHRKGLLPAAYRIVNIPSMKRINKLIVVGNATVEESVKIGIDRGRCVFVPNGVNADDLREEHSREELSGLLGQDVAGKKVILRLARFVPHKGTSWFIENVIPRLPEDVIMIAAGHRVGKGTPGDRDDFLHSRKAVNENQLESRVKLLPSIPREDVKILLNTVDLVVSPNIKVSGSMEGFGINVIEAGVCERIVIASRLDGLEDAIKDGENGFLVESGNVEEWVAKTEAVLSSGDNDRRELGRRAREYIQANYSWEMVCQKYMDVMEQERDQDLEIQTRTEHS